MLLPSVDLLSEVTTTTHCFPPSYFVRTSSLLGFSVCCARDGPRASRVVAPRTTARPPRARAKDELRASHSSQFEISCYSHGLRAQRWLALRARWARAVAIPWRCTRYTRPKSQMNDDGAVCYLLEAAAITTDRH